MASDDMSGAHPLTSSEAATQDVASPVLARGMSVSVISQLAGGMALDFNNIFTLILAHAEQLLTSAGDRLTSEEHAELIEILRGATRGADVVRKLRAFGRQESIRLAPVALGRVVADFLETMTRLDSRLAITLTMDDGLPMVRADVRAVEAIVRQLVSNARDASVPHKGITPLKVWIGLRPGPARGPAAASGAAAQHVVVQFDDEGTGMSPLTLHHACDPYFTTKPAEDGKGLGLAMVDGLMHQMGGMLEIESHLGDGTTVVLHFPVAPPVVDPPTRHTLSAGAVPSSAATRRILVVEDDEAVRGLMARTLRTAGFTVVEATDGEDAVSAVEWAATHHEPFGVVVSDVVMPYGGGARVLRAVQEQMPEARLLWVTGFPGTPDTTGGPPSRDPILEKPWTTGELLAAVRRVLATPPVGVSR